MSIGETISVSLVIIDIIEYASIFIVSDIVMRSLVKKTIGLYKSAEFHVRLLQLCRTAQKDIRMVMDSSRLSDQEKNLCCHEIVRDRIVKPLFSAMNIQLHLSGHEHIPQDDSCIVAANHNSELDHLVTTTLLGFPTLTLAKESIKKVPFMGEVWGSAITECIDRSDRQKAVAGLEKVERKLRNGQSVVMFPEGTRNKTKELLLPFTTGTADLALKTHKKIVPLVLKNTATILPSPKKPYYPTALYADRIEAEFLAPLDPLHYQYLATDNKKRKSLTNDLRRDIAEALLRS